MDIEGGLIGKQKGHYTIGGGLRCRFVSGGTLMVRGDVWAQGEIIQSRLTLCGRLSVPDGVIYGGEISANGGVACKALGHVSGVPTLVEAGEGKALRLLMETASAQAESNRRRIATVRSAVEPMLKQMKTLTPQQREKATELLYEAGELEAATAKTQAAFEQRAKLIRQHARAEITVADVVHAGVTVRFRSIEATLATPLRGPLVLTLRNTDGASEIVMIDGTDRSTCVLPARSVTAEGTPLAA